ncbi:hypothetical protein CWB41_13785 [Methylovirgula ligni]|uniref:Uncharacterized protein n=1 Tax=Methylovirgula ligni TaxID=569860 RepID=A0A3D9YL80_9HYPH|nr:hypothetical protein [Methylovirgula ligni]QAY96665.1 hypothetical protein CWB41_13785 [Methylovirgula ligni]REF83294.1 hypothetical protein DES32_3210 [Methylovirgula ligni]
MFRWITYRLKLAKELRDLARVERSYEKDRKALLGAPNAAVETAKLSTQYDVDFDLSHETIALLQTRYFRAVAAERRIPLPGREGRFWQESKLVPDDILTAEGLGVMQQAVWRHRTEWLDSWAPGASVAFAGLALVLSFVSLLVSIFHHGSCQ